MASDADRLIEQLRAGLPALLPTDTVYGLVSTPGEREVERLYALKGRAPEQPTALLGATVEQLLAARARARASRAGARDAAAGAVHARAAEPVAPLSLAGGLRRAARSASGFPNLPEEARRVLAAVGCVAATSANEPGGPDPRTLADVPERLRAACPALDARDAARNAVDGARPHRRRAASAPRGRVAVCRGDRPRPERPSTIRVMAVAHQTFDELKTLGLAEIDPEIARAARA